MSQPDPSLLEDRIPKHLQSSRRLAGCLFGFCLIFGWFVLKPLWHTDLWGHLSYGRYLVSAGSLPATEPLMSLAKGVPFVDTAWLSQVVGYLTYQQWGIAGLQGLLALTITLTAVVLHHRMYERTRTNLLAWGGVALFLWFNWGTLAVARPQLAGQLCFVLLLHRLTSRHPRSSDLFFVPALMAVWANLHGSFAIGLLLLATFCAGRAIDLWRRSGTLRSWFHDQSLRRLLVWTQLAAAAVLINPYGLGLYAEVLAVSENPNLQALTEWQPLDLRAAHGIVFALSAISLIVVYRFTPRRVAAWEAFLLLGLGFASLWSARFSVWWGPVAALLFTLHAHACCRHWLPWRAEPRVSPVNGKWSVVSLGLLWIFFAYSPPGMRILHGRSPALEKAVSTATPVALTDWLTSHPPTGLVFNPYEWGDYLTWAGPSEMSVFLNSHAQYVPREVWSHYLQVMDQSAEWPEVLNRYGVNTVILDQEYRTAFIRRLKEDPAWKVDYEDERGAVFSRRRPI